MNLSARRRAGLLALLALLALTLGGCSNGAAQDEGQPQPETSYQEEEQPTSEQPRDGSQPQLDGPWAHELATLYAESNDFVRAILADGQITFQEANEALLRANACVAAAGFPQEYVVEPEGRRYLGEPTNYVLPNNEFGHDGGFGFFGESHSEADWEIIMACGNEYFLGLAHLRHMMAVDPLNEALSWYEQWHACLRRHNVVPASFTIADLEALSAARYWPQTCAEASVDPRVLHFTCDGDRLDEIELFPEYTDGNRDMLLPDGTNLNAGQGLACQVNPAG
jgi:hypothetical protein